MVKVTDELLDELDWRADQGVEAALKRTMDALEELSRNGK